MHFIHLFLFLIPPQLFPSPPGCLPHPMITGKFDVVLSALIGATEITPNTASWARTRKEAICSVLRLVDTVGIKTDGKGNIG